MLAPLATMPASRASRPSAPPATVLARRPADADEDSRRASSCRRAKLPNRTLYERGLREVGDDVRVLPRKVSIAGNAPRRLKILPLENLHCCFTLPRQPVASTMSAMSATDHNFSVTPTAIAGV